MERFNLSREGFFVKLLNLFKSSLWKTTWGRHCWELIAVAEKTEVREWLETEATAMKKKTQR